MNNKTPAEVVREACQAFARMQGRQAAEKLFGGQTYEQFEKAMRAALDAALSAPQGEDGRHPCPRGNDCEGRDCPKCANFYPPPNQED